MNDASAPPPSSGFGWSRSQQRAVLLIMVGLLALLVIRYIRNPVYVSDPQPETPSRALDLADRIDPNTADWAALAALPGIGEKRAREMVAYRDQAVRDAAHPVPFTQPSDMLRMKGVGPSLLRGMEPFLIFPAAPAAPAATRPAEPAMP